jgi:hypothetical protein
MNLLNHPTELIIGLGVLVVWLTANFRFNDPRILMAGATDASMDWKKYLQVILSWSPGRQSLLIRPPRANTTAFHYRLYQSLYALLAVLIYLAMIFLPDFNVELQAIIKWFTEKDMPNITNAGPLVIAAFVVMILPNVPPFRWADTSLRRKLYERALIPAQQLREVNRLDMAPYNPPAELYEKMHTVALAEGFNEHDINYDPRNPTTQSLWFKSLLLVEHIKIWEADNHYKTAFAALKEPDSNRRSVNVVKEMQRDLITDAHLYFEQLRRPENQDDDELNHREGEFRLNCRALLRKIYSLLAAISLHSHYSDNERINKLGAFGIKLEPEPGGPMPDANDMLILAIILCVVLVVPLGLRIGAAKAIMIGAIILSAVLTPVILARFCPKIRKPTTARYAPNVVYPILSGIVAATVGFLIILFSEPFIEPAKFCQFTGLERYVNCSYPWSILHASTAMLLAVCLCVGRYPEVRQLQGWRRYRQWGSFSDAALCAFCMFLISFFVAMPLLESLRPLIAGSDMKLSVAIRMTLVAFILGFVVPTWYRSQKSRVAKVNRRHHLGKRERFQRELAAIRQGQIHISSKA